MRTPIVLVCSLLIAGVVGQHHHPYFLNSNHGEEDERAPWIIGAPLVRAHLPPTSTCTRTETTPSTQLNFERAEVRMSGLGWSYATINGQRVDPTRQLDPGWTYYRRNALYSTFDITSYLQFPSPNTSSPTGNIDKNNNTLQISMGGGHFASNWYQGTGENILFAEVHYFYSSSSSGESQQRLALSTADLGSWYCSMEGPVREASVYGGEVYDARRENPPFPETWSSCPNATEKAIMKWNPTVDPLLYKLPEKLVSQDFPPIREQQLLKPADSWEMTTTEGHKKFFFDFGQNFAGVLQIQVQNCVRGMTLVLQHAELLWPNRTLNRVNLGRSPGANATDVYICKGSATQTTEVFQPSFTYHGFQYASIEVLLHHHQSSASAQSATPTLSSVRAVVLHSDLTQLGHFTTSHAVLQGIHHMTLWSQRSNLMSIPTDCPQRDERLGWLADAQLSAQEANLNFDMLDFYRSFTKNNMATSLNKTRGQRTSLLSAYQIPDIVPDCDAENGLMGTKCNRPYTRPADPAWGSAFIIIPWATYQATGNSTILKENFDDFELYVNSTTNLTNSDGILNFGDFGDWEAISKVDTPLISTSYLYVMQSLLSKIALVLDRQDRAQVWQLAANLTKTNFNRVFFNSSECSYITRFGYQSANAVPLYNGLVPDEKKDCVVQTLVSYIKEGDVCPSGNNSRCNSGHLSVGIVGAQALLPVLSSNGYHDLAVQIASTTTYPSWGYMWASNATTLWENWQNTYLPSEDASHNHIMFGSIDVWLYEHFAGISVRPSPLVSSSEQQQDRDDGRIIIELEVTVDLSHVCSLAGHTAEASVRGGAVSVEHRPVLTTTATGTATTHHHKYISTIVEKRKPPHSTTSHTVRIKGKKTASTSPIMTEDLDTIRTEVITQC